MRKGNGRRSSRLSTHLYGGFDENCDHGDVAWHLRRLLEPDSNHASIAPSRRKAAVHRARWFEGHHRAQIIHSSGYDVGRDALIARFGNYGP